MEPRCVWTNESSERLEPVTLRVWESGLFRRQKEVALHVLPEHKDDLIRYNQRSLRLGRVYAVLMLTLFLTIMLGAFALGSWIVPGIGYILVGLVSIALPYGHPLGPLTVSGHPGIRYSIRYHRSAGCVAAAFGILYLAWGAYMTAG